MTIAVAVYDRMSIVSSTRLRTSTLHCMRTGLASVSMASISLASVRHSVSSRFDRTGGGGRWDRELPPTRETLCGGETLGWEILVLGRSSGGGGREGGKAGGEGAGGAWRGGDTALTGETSTKTGSGGSLGEHSTWGALGGMGGGLLNGR